MRSTMSDSSLSSSTPRGDFRPKPIIALVLAGAVLAAAGLFAQAQRKPPLEGLSAAFPRSTLLYAECRITPEMRAMFSPEGLKAGGITDDEYAQLLHYATSMTRDALGLALDEAELRLLNDNMSAVAFGVTGFSMDGMNSAQVPFQFTIAALHTQGAKVAEILKREFERGSTCLSSHREKDGVRLFGVTPPKRGDAPLDAAAIFSGTLGIADGKWIVFAQSEGQALEAVDGLRGVGADERLSAAAGFRASLGEVDPTAQSIGYVSFSEMWALAGKADAELFGNLAAFEIDRIQACGGWSRWDVKDSTMTGSSRLTFRDNKPPSWYAPLRATPKAPTLTRLAPERSFLTLWSGYDRLDERANTLVEFFKKHRRNLPFDGMGEGGEDGDHFSEISGRVTEALSMVGGEQLFCLHSMDGLMEGMMGGERSAKDVSFFGAALLNETATETRILSILKELADNEKDFGLKREADGFKVYEYATEGRSGVSIAVALSKDMIIVGSKPGVELALKRHAENPKPKAEPPASLSMTMRFEPMFTMLESVFTRQLSMMGMAEAEVELEGARALLDVFKTMEVHLRVRTENDRIEFDSHTSGLPGSESLGALVRAALDASRAEKAKSNLKKLAAGATLARELSANDDYPAGLAELARVAGVAREHLHDPFDPYPARDGAESYVYQKPPAKAEPGERYMVAWQRKAWLPGDKRMIVLLDGTVERLTEEQFKEALDAATKGRPIPAFRPRFPGFNPDMFPPDGNEDY